MAEYLAVTTRRTDRFTNAEFAAELPAEQCRARELFAERTFRCIWSRHDGKGAVVLMEAPSREAAEQVWRTLPFAASGMVDVEIIGLDAYTGFQVVAATP